MSFDPCPTDAYLDWPSLEAWMRGVAAACPEWLSLATLGETRHGRPILLLTVGRRAGDPEQRPGFWLDGGTHCAEWAGVMGAAHTVSRWLEGLMGSDGALQAWFSEHTAYVVPCVSPDGYQAMIEGAPFIRSSLRPPGPGAARTGLDPCDVDGDGAVRWMRWRHPAGPFVADPQVPVYMRPRTLDDAPEDAWFVCPEGEFVHWDGQRWTTAPLEFGVDLNRNFPSHWAPFSMFGMDSGAYPGSEPESRALIEAVAARPYIAAALSNHTYTGALLTQPYRKDSPISDADQRLMEALGKDAVQGTGYDVIRVHPEFTYDANQPIVGVWSDALAGTFGLPGYTLELWNPFRHAGVERPNVAEFFRTPDPALTGKLLGHFAALPGAVTPWRPFSHPQLGEVEVGGIDYMRTIRNPPLAALAEELDRAFTVADRLRRALPRVRPSLECVERAPDLTEVVLVLDNEGYLATSALGRGEQVQPTPGVRADLHLEGDLELVQGEASQGLGHMDGWGTQQHGGAGHPIYPDLPGRGHRAVARWWVRGHGRVLIEYTAGRGGVGTVEAKL